MRRKKHRPSRAALELALCGVEQREIAESLNVHHCTVSRWLAGLTPAPARLEELLVQRLGPAASRVLSAIDTADSEASREATMR